MVPSQRNDPTEDELNPLADEQQVDLSWVDQIDVGQSVHPLQTRVDPTVQLQHKQNPGQNRAKSSFSEGARRRVTMIFLPLNSRMMQDRPTSCPAPLATHTNNLRHPKLKLVTLTFSLDKETVHIISLSLVIYTTINSSNHFSLNVKH